MHLPNSIADTGRVPQASYATLLGEHGHTSGLVAQARQRMEATLAREFRLSELAAHLAVSERTLHRRFKEAVRRGPLGYFQTLCVEVAKRLLETGQVRFEAASEQVGYRYVGTFRDFFKCKTGLSPCEYQRQSAWVTGARPGMTRRRRNRLIYMINIDECFSTLNFASSSRK